MGCLGKRHLARKCSRWQRSQGRSKCGQSREQRGDLVAGWSEVRERGGGDELRVAESQLLPRVAS